MLVQSARPISSRRLAALLAAAVALLVLVMAPAAEAAPRSEFVVDTLEDRSEGECAATNECSLREALELVAEGEAGGAVGDVEILIQVPNQTGTKQTLELNESLEVSTGSHVSSVELVGPGAELFAIDGQAESRVLEVNGDVTLEGLTIEGGRTDSGGAGILVEGGSLKLVDTSVEDNHAEEEGGGLLVEAGTATIERGKFADNSSSGDEGGAIAASGGKVKVDDAQLLDNHAESGGALAASGEAEVTIWRTLLEWNKATESGGAIFTSSSKALVVEESEITANEAVKYGGAVYLRGPATIEGSTVNGNYVPEPSENGEGGTITARDDGTLTLDTSTVYGNSGTAILGNGLIVRRSTIVDNAAAYNAGGIEGTGETVVSSVIFGNTSSGNFKENCEGVVSAGGSNYVGVGRCEFVQEDNFVERTASPELGPLDYYGGATKTMPPVSRWSPLINAGAEPRSTDQRGESRPVPNAPSDTDIGAVEVQAPTLDAAPVLEAPEGMGVGKMLECQAAKGKGDTVENPGYSLSWEVGGDSVQGEAQYLWVEERFAGKPITCEETIDNGATTASLKSNALELAPAKPTASPTKIEFGEVPVDSGTEPQEIELSEAGEVSFEIYDVSVSSSEYELERGGCPSGRHVPELSCVVAVSFHPKTAGSHPAKVEFLTSAGEVTVELTGVGAMPELTLSTEEIEFGVAEVGSPSPTFEVIGTNTGGDTLNIYGVEIEGDAGFEEVSDTCAWTEVAPGDTCKVQVRFVPTGPGEKTAALKVSSYPHDREVALSGFGLEAGFSASPDSFDFGDQTHDTTSAAQRFEITNPGTVPLQVGQVAIGGADAGEFLLALDECSGHTVAVGDSCAIEVSFLPAGSGEAAAQIEFPTNIGGPVKTVALSGTGTAPAFGASPASVEFGDVRIGSTAGPQTVLVENAGNEAMTIGTPVLEGADAAAFALAAGGSCAGAVLQPGDMCELRVAFTPAAARAYAAALKVPGSAPGTVPLSGTGAEGELSMSPTSAEFGSVAVGAQASEEFVVSSDGPVAVDLGEIKLAGVEPGSFWVNGEDCEHRLLAPHEFCEVNVGFVPASVGSKTAFVEFEGSSLQIPLAGTGVAPKLEVAPAALDFGSVEIGGASAPRLVTVKNVGSSAATLAVQVGGVDASRFQLASLGTCLAAPLAAGGECALEVAFRPLAAGTATAEVVVATGDESVAVALGGSAPEPAPGPAPSPSPDPTPPAPPSPVASAAMRAPRGPLTVGGSGSLGVALTCDAPAGSTCPLKVTLLPAGKAGKLPKRLGSWAGSIAGGASRTVKVPLGKGAKAALAAAGRLHAVLVLDWGAGEERIPVVIKAPRSTKH